MYCRGKDYLDKFDPNAYLQGYASIHDSRVHHMLRCYYEAFQVLPDNLKVLDYGSGPSLMMAIVATTKASEITLSDFSPNNRQSLQRWLDNDDTFEFDWTPHFNFFAKELKRTGEKGVAESEQQLRAAVKAVVQCDMTQDPPIEAGYVGPYDVVTSSLALDTTAYTYEEFVDVLSRVSKLVKRGGSLFLYFTENGPLYQVGDNMFEGFSVDSDLVEKTMEKVGFKEIQTFTKFSDEHKTYFFVKGIRK